MTSRPYRRPGWQRPPAHGKLGAVAGAFLVPQLEMAIDLRGRLVVAAGTRRPLLSAVLPEPAARATSGRRRSDLDPRVDPGES